MFGLIGQIFGGRGTAEFVWGIARWLLLAVFLIVAGILVWMYQSVLLSEVEVARLERDVAVAAKRETEARVKSLEAALETMRRERQAAIEARQRAERQITAQLGETRRLLAEVQAARARAAREGGPALTAEEAAECRAIIEAYRRLAPQP